MENKKVGFLVNDYNLKNDQATTYLLKKISSFFDSVYIFSVKSFNNDFTIDALHLDVSLEDSLDVKGDLQGLDEVRISLRKLSLVLIRTNPARDFINHKYHQRSLDYLEKLEGFGVPIINSPRSLKNMHSKEYLFSLPHETIPLSAMIYNNLDLTEFYYYASRKIVLKPLIGTRGEGIELIDNEDKLNKKFNFPMIAQEFVEDNLQADKRVCLFDGEVMEIEDVKGVVRRIPKKGEFRSNVFLGGRADIAELDQDDLSTIDRVRPWLVQNGLRYVGLDLLGGKIIEINCFSPGGIQDYERFYKKPFGDYLIGSILEEL